MDDFIIEPKMIDFGNNSENKFQKLLNNIRDDNYKEEDNLLDEDGKK
ncbi:hypothetical protein NNC19_03650 [Clostridium sp. SHJSY1]|nr:hypothetical protein [Clostridium sp. SHJSY1]MDS0524761.1 hypothetical protein [Clostridium sp. SHJSY1]